MGAERVAGWGFPHKRGLSRYFGQGLTNCPIWGYKQRVGQALLERDNLRVRIKLLRSGHIAAPTF
jgi:hypothetical protein